MIGVTGGSGSGKTTIIKKLRKEFSEKEVCIISQDDYYKPRENQKIDKEGITNFDLPKSIDKEAFERDIKMLISNNNVSRPKYTFNNKKAKAEMLTFKAAPIIIVEGLFVFHFKKIRKLCDLKVFIHAKENLKISRRIQRDQVERNYPLEDVLYRYENHVTPSFEKYIKPYIEKADIVVNNNKNYEKGLTVLTGFIRQRLT